MRDPALRADGVTGAGAGGQALAGFFRLLLAASLFGASGLALGAALEQEALATVLRHAAWCASPAGGPEPGGVGLSGHCAWCWAAAALSFAGGAVLGARPRA